MQANVDPKEWDAFVEANASDSGILQSYQWGEFQRAHGENVVHIQKKIEETIVFQAMLFEHKLPFGLSYLYCPRGPIFLKEEALTGSKKGYRKEMWDVLMNDCLILAKERKILFCDFEPADAISGEELVAMKMEVLPTRQPQETVLLDLKKPEAELLTQMKQKTRYNIKVAQKNGVVVKRMNWKEGLNYFLDLLHQTTERQQFVAHKDDYYREMIEVLEPAGMAEIYVAFQHEKPIAAHLLVYFGKTAIYLHGASDYQARSSMAPYLLHWQEIQDAKHAGFEVFDFWGVATKGALKEKWAGFSRLKLSWQMNPWLQEYPGRYRIVYRNVFYFLYRLILSLRA